MDLFLFIILSVVCIGAVLGMILSKNQAYSALYVVLVFACTAGFFALLSAPFIAVVQIIIYAGAILVLFIFVIMMVDIDVGLTPEKKKGTLYLAALLGAILLIEVLIALKAAFPTLGAVESSTGGSPSELGYLLFTKYLYPFEITSILIIAALVGAIVLVKKREQE
jgi:NADH-quinone oxidoreductase subunit J